MIWKYTHLTALALLAFLLVRPLQAQQVTMPLPHLLTLMPMGGQAGTSVEVTLTGDNIENVSALLFSNPKITAKSVLDSNGKAVENKFTVSIASDVPVGVYDARVLSRLGVSSARAFSVNKWPELVRTQANNSVETAMALPLNAICNATSTRRAVDYYVFQGTKGKRVAVDCAARGIDSRLSPVVALADAHGQDLVVNRTGGLIEYTLPADGAYMIKVNDLTYQGDERHFYRLALQEVNDTGDVARQPQTQSVSAMSWPPTGLAPSAKQTFVDEKNTPSQVKSITLPCDIAGRFYPAAHVDTYEFPAKKGETWWVEVASERLGLNTYPFVMVQKVTKAGGKETLTDVQELKDIPSPMKLSSNGYSYDGPPYDAGSRDVLGKFEVKEDGTYRLQVRDLFGGTRNDPNNVYRLLVRQATPDFSLAAWAVHMTLRNGDRAALSKPMALRAGTSRVFEVVVIRRDGFDGEIEIAMENLPPGVHAAGLKIAQGASYGHLILTAESNAQASSALAKIMGRATIDGKAVEHPCRVASMAWPVKDATQEIPAPRLMADVPVSVTHSEEAPLTIAVADPKTFTAKSGESVKIPLKLTWRNDFTGSSIKLKAYGAGFEKLKEVEIPVKAATYDAVLDLASLKLTPGDYTIALYGTAVSKYRYNAAAIPLVEAEQKKAEEAAIAAAAEAKKIAPTDAKAAKAAAEKQKQAETAMASATVRMKAVTTAAEPKDTVDIIVSEPIQISIKPAQIASAAAPSAK